MVTLYTHAYGCDVSMDVLCPIIMGILYVCMGVHMYVLLSHRDETSKPHCVLPLSVLQCIAYCYIVTGKVHCISTSSKSQTVYSRL